MKAGVSKDEYNKNLKVADENSEDNQKVEAYLGDEFQKYCEIKYPSENAELYKNKQIL